MKKQKGLSLIETLFALSIITLIALGSIQLMASAKEKELNKKFSTEISGLLYATDRRLFIDKFRDNDFREQIESNFPENFKKAFISRDHSCGNKDGWTPIGYSDVALLPCSFWNKKIPYDLNISISIKEKNEYITKVNYDYSFKNFKKYEKFPSLLLNLNKMIKDNLVPLHAGTINTYFIDNNNQKLNTVQCIRKKDECILRTEFKPTPLLLLEDELVK